MKKIIQNLSIVIISMISFSFFACNKADNILPILKLNGDAIENVVLNAPYIDKGAAASDDKDGDITKSIIVKNEVNINKVGTYNIMYSVSDKAGNVAPTLTRIVNVENTSSKYIGSYAAANYTYYPVIDTTTFISNLSIDSTVNNKLFFSVFSDTLVKKTNVYAIVYEGNIEIPYQKVTISSNSKEYSFQGYGAISETAININYFKGIEGILYSCKADFIKQ